MKTSTIKVSFASDNFWAAINEFLLYAHKIQTEAPEKVIFDLSGCTFLVPHIIGGIIALAKSLKEKGCQIEYIPPPDITYIETIHFPGGEDFTGFTPEAINENLMKFYSKTYLPIISFPAKNAEASVRERVMSAVSSILKNQLRLDGNILQAIFYLIDELTQNVVDHSGASHGTIFAQYFPAKHYMDLCISDCGKGIYKAYLDSGKHSPVDNTEALGFAVKGKSVKDLPDSRGFGLSTSRKMLVHGLKGMFFILSGDSFFIELPDEPEKLLQLKDLYYQGCYIALRIPLKNDGNFDLYKFVE